ncbi:2-hydroxyglutaryl-CoA dehydratase [Desulfosarcina ovata subsp. sediminis]|uniref:2-hydroxyglutaryl-CoA dehydratase n=1 Tax=Desulfosarcina ovata subsp. sediminis TaxID=885957 RepID=A0A5K7ZVE3_9BACT|nr:acyl-CoA dehydratase activase [Desulfosarcina ovata]BBO84207.1 2-hydroxyglutaryl-CoA dehydratase [Desulfosarcina ovata subsp. sediminis]
MSQPVFLGIDLGASRTKVAILDSSKNLIGRAVQNSGTNYTRTAEVCLEAALAMAGAGMDDIVAGIGTGYGRSNVPFVGDTKTEIACHGKGCFHYFPHAISIIDIGGQDNKIIKLSDAGLRTEFKMNRKCAAGTGAFLEEMSLRLNIPLEAMNDQAKQSTEMVKLGSYCTVFSGTEVLENIRNGKKVEDIVKGLFFSVIKRVLEMDSLSENVVMTGGVVAHNPYLVSMAEEIIGRSIHVPPYPQFSGAIGAALFAMNHR